jgi:antirestriction protein ArdC
MPRTPDHSELLAQLAEGVSDLASSERWRRHLEVQSRFHQYSFHNIRLIVTQCPGATRVASFRTWRSLERPVRKGEKAIYILAPLLRREAGSGTEGDEDRRVVRGFKFVPVFDLSQTDGDTLPTVCQRLDGDDPARHFDRLVGVAQSLGYTVERADLPAGTNGDCTFATHRIRIERANSPAQQVKSLAHEIAHALLHEGCPDRRLAELEAESTAFVVCRSLGLDPGAYSFGYVTSWAGGGTEAVAGIKAAGGRIQRAASRMLRPAVGDAQAAA